MNTQTGLKKCKECYSEIPFKAKKCPNCRSDQRSWVRRHPIISFLGIIIILPIVLSSMAGSREKIADQEQIKVAEETQPVIFNIPSLLDKTVTEIETELGTPSWDKQPTKEQIALGTTEWDKNWDKDGQTMMVTYYIKSGKVKDIFLEAKGDIYEKKDKHKLLRVGNLILDSDKYTVKFVDQLGKPGYFTGLTVMKTSPYSDFEVCAEAGYLVQKALKSPSTAKFPPTSACTIQRLENDGFKVSSYVDSQNGFGAMIRSNWSVTFYYVEGGMTQTDLMTIDGETVYKR